MAERLGDRRALREALRARQMARSGPDGVHERLALGDRLVALGADSDDDAALWGRLWRFDALAQLGDLDAAEAELGADRRRGRPAALAAGRLARGPVPGGDGRRPGPLRRGDGTRLESASGWPAGPAPGARSAVAGDADGLPHAAGRPGRFPDAKGICHRTAIAGPVTGLQLGRSTRSGCWRPASGTRRTGSTGPCRRRPTVPPFVQLPALRLDGRIRG